MSWVPVLLPIIVWVRQRVFFTTAPSSFAIDDAERRRLRVPRVPHDDMVDHVFRRGVIYDDDLCAFTGPG
ncbi:hypothetical protein B5M45_29820 [Mycobacterium simiae]|uniref:Uncharacterized protein n=1 Tax=Mycobacterium simiae TaxID=1784 RepID=A0A1X0XJJ3_MYCSI|nr:hypothetical protein B5M45_29820 [Mycobacterium simiae]